MTPAECVIAAFGGVRKTARALKLQPGSVVQWRRRGLVPNRVQVEIIKLVNIGLVQISAEALIVGAPKG